MDPQNIHPRNLAEKAGHLFRMSQNCKFWYLTCCDNSVYISPLEDEIYLICKAVLPFVRSALCSASALCMYLISRSTLCFRPEDVCVIRLNRYQQQSKRIKHTHTYEWKHFISSYVCHQGDPAIGYLQAYLHVTRTRTCTRTNGNTA